MRRDLATVARITGGELVGAAPTAPWAGFAIDSRRIEGGELFFAFRGEHTDGHRFVRTALASGAAAAVVERPEEGAGPQVVVEDALEALHALARELRQEIPHLAAVTGSSGKTSTKELLAALLGSRFRVAKSPGNLNSLYGFPIAVERVPATTEWMVAEMGMSTPGELGRLSRLGRPDLVVVTNVRPAHLEGLGSLDAVAAAKAEILEGLAPEGTLVANRDDPRVVAIAARHPGRVVWFGVAGSVRAVGIELDARGTHFDLEVEEGGRTASVPIRLPLFGRHNVENFLAAAAAAWALGVALTAMPAGAASVRASPGRGVVHQLDLGAVLVDDSYNSSPGALDSVLRSVAELPGERHWAVLGSMLELGADSEEYHRVAGRLAVSLGFDPVCGVGVEARELAAAAGRAGRWFPDPETVRPFVVDELAAGDVVLVKGSRGVGLDRLVEGLVQ